MGDDLSAFFAKKAQKKKEKKNKGVIRIDDVGNQLERKARIQEQEDLEEQEREQLELADDRFLKSQENEDSEWLEFTDTKNRLADVRVRDMDYSDAIEEETAEEKAATEHIKTWKIESKEDKEGNEENLVKPTQKQPVAYRPPMSRTVQKKAQLDLNNDEMFPSLANADKIAKELEEKKKQEEEQRKKNPAAFQKEESFVEAPTQQKYIPRRDQSDRENQSRGPRTTDRDGFTEVRRKEPPPASRADEVDTWRSARPAVQKSAEPAPATAAAPPPKTGAYIPPHLRRTAQQNQ